jgi:hypothetical protein
MEILYAEFCGYPVQKTVMQDNGDAYVICKAANTHAEPLGNEASKFIIVKNLKDSKPVVLPERYESVERAEEGLKVVQLKVEVSRLKKENETLHNVIGLYEDTMGKLKAQVEELYMMSPHVELESEKV